MSLKPATFTDLINNNQFRSRDIDNQEVLRLLRQADQIPRQLLPFKGVIHVIDYTQGKHVGISGDFKNIIGYDERDFMDNGLNFVMDIFHKDDFEIFNQKVFKCILSFQDENKGNLEDHLFSFNYRMRRSDGKLIQIYQQGSYVLCPKTKLPLYGIGVATDITSLKKDSSILLSIDKKIIVDGHSSYQNLLTEYYYPDPKLTLLTRREREILRWLSDGLSSKQIASKLFISESTIANHRKNMMKKTSVKNIAELVRYASEAGLL